MILLPKWKPAVENLNSFYLDVHKMIEHYQGELGTGCVHFRSAAEEAVLFFDKDEHLGSVVNAPEGELIGNAATDRIINNYSFRNFIIDIYRIETDKIYLWANIPKAQIALRLTSDATDLEALVRKLISTKLTGFMEVSVHNGPEGGVIFLSNGRLVGNFYSWANGNASKSPQDFATLIHKVKTAGGDFKVCRIPVKSNSVANTGNIKAHAAQPVQFDVLEALLIVFEKTVTSQKQFRNSFNRLLKQKFVEKAEKFEFVDPFAAEFSYADQKVAYVGNRSNAEVIVGVVECVTELAADLGLSAILNRQLTAWSDQYAKEIEVLNLSL